MLASWFVAFGADIRERITPDDAAPRVALPLAGGDFTLTWLP